MGNCLYCGQKVGFLKDIHPECQEKRNLGKELMKNIVVEYYNKNKISQISEEVNRICKESFIGFDEKMSMLNEGLSNLVDSFFDDGVVSSEEEEKYFNIVNTIGVIADKLYQEKYHQKMMQGIILRSLVNGIIPENVVINGDIPFILEKDEKVVYYFNDVEYYEMKSIKQYSGVSSGLSIRLAKGVYLRSSSFKGRPIEHQEMISYGKGKLLVGSKHLYYSGTKSFKIQYSKIFMLQPYSDGIGFQKENPNAKLQALKLNDGWFICNVVQNLIEINKR